MSGPFENFNLGTVADTSRLTAKTAPPVSPPVVYKHDIALPAQGKGSEVQYRTPLQSAKEVLAAVNTIPKSFEVL